MNRSVLFVVFLAGCVSHAAVGTTRTTSSEVETRESIEVAASHVERDVARRTLEEELTRSAAAEQERLGRARIADEAWERLDRVDARLGAMRDRLAVTTPLASRQELRERLATIERHRAKVSTLLRRVATEPEETWPFVRVQLAEALDIVERAAGVD